MMVSASLGALAASDDPPVFFESNLCLPGQKPGSTQAGCAQNRRKQQENSVKSVLKNRTLLAKINDQGRIWNTNFIQKCRILITIGRNRKSIGLGAYRRNSPIRLEHLPEIVRFLSPAVIIKRLAGSVDDGTIITQYALIPSIFSFAFLTLSSAVLNFAVFNTADKQYRRKKTCTYAESDKKKRDVWRCF